MFVFVRNVRPHTGMIVRTKGVMRKGSRVSLYDRLMAKTEMSAPGECWPWIGVRRKGYGRLTFDGKYLSAHRIAWLFKYGFIPRGLKVLHRCDNPGCVNPYHLFLGTQKDNMQDCSRKGRMPFRKGEFGSNHKLTNEQVLSIRKLHTEGKTNKELCGLFGIKKAQMGNIINKKQWVHI
jgi:hypothetical protein